MKELGQMEALQIIYDNTKDCLVVGNMNMTTWCIQPIVRKDYPHGTQPDNLLFGIDMTMCTAFAVGLAEALPHRKVVAVDGDAAILMKMVTLGDAAKSNPKNMVIVIIDNESAGGRVVEEPSLTASVVDLCDVSKASGIKNSVTVTTPADLEKELKRALAGNELACIVAKVELKDDEIAQGFDERYWVDVEWKSSFIRHIEKTEGIELITRTKVQAYELNALTAKDF